MGVRKLLVSASKTANQCQRNWDRNKKISQLVKYTLINIAIDLPTKQNQAYYHLLVSDNPVYNKNIYKCSIDEENKGTKDRNSQVDSPLLFIYLKNEYTGDNFKYAGHEKKDSIQQQQHVHNFNATLSAGISSGAVALAANQLGMRTGFCCCYNTELLKNYLKSIGYTLDSNIITMLGIGYPNTNFHSNVVLKDESNDILRYVERYDKKVTYTIL